MSQCLAVGLVGDVVTKRHLTSDLAEPTQPSFMTSIDLEVYIQALTKQLTIGLMTLRSVG